MKRRIVMLVLLLIGGAIVNVAVAWGCVLKQPPLRVSAGILAKELKTDFFGYPAWREPLESNGIGYRQRRLHLQPEEMFSNRRWHAAVGVEAGWPILALCGAHRGSCGNGDISHGHGDGAIAVHSEDGRPHVLPLHPKWGGFLFNTSLYGALIWLIFFAPFAMRRMIRRRRGQCETCAYPIGASPVCTECGAAVERPRRTDA